MKKNNKSTKLFSLFFLILFCLYFQTIAYSAISSNLAITGDAIARIRSNVRINKFKIHEVSAGVISSYEEFSKTYTMSNVTLPYSDSYIIYELVVGNYEDVEMQLSNITGLNSNLTYELIDYNLHDMICDNNSKCFGGAEKTFYLKIKYSNYNASGTNYNINLNYEFKEFSNKLMVGNSFKNTIPSAATHLVFTDEKPAAGIALTDVSADQDMGVVGYLDGTTYKISTRRTGIMPEANADSSYMFNGSSLIDINLSNLNSEKITSISYMFQDCTNLSNIVFGDDWNTSNITEMRSLFKNCSDLTAIDLSSFVTNNVTSFSEMFYGCSSLVNVDVNHFDVSKSTSFREMFRNCSSLVSLDVSNWVIKKSCGFSSFLHDCVSLVTFIGDDLVNSNVTNINSIFYNNQSLKNLYISNWDTSKVTSIYGIFKSNTSLTSLDLSGWDVSNVTNGTWVFEACTSMISLNLSGWKFTKSISLNGMFHGMTKLETLNLDGWDTSGVTSVNRTFVNLYKLKVLDLSSWNTSNITDTGAMFNNCQILEKIYVGAGWDLSNVASSETMFLHNFKLSNYDASYTDKTRAYVGDGGYLSYLPKEMTIDGVTYQYDEGMTWGEWVNSSYDTRGFVNNNDLIYTDDLTYALVYEVDNGSYTSYGWPYATDLIDPNLVYVTFYEAGEDGEW